MYTQYVCHAVIVAPPVRVIVLSQLERVIHEADQNVDEAINLSDFM